MIIFSPSYGYSKFRRISCTVAVIKSIGIKTIDAMLKQLHINGLVLCNHLISTLDLRQNILSFLGTFQKLPLGGGRELWRHPEFAILWDVNSHLAYLPRRSSCQF